MKNENLDFFKQQASIREKDEIDAFRKVLDPRDVRGVKNRYLDIYLKYYLQQYLNPGKEDVLLEVGCGIGRLTEYLSRFAHTVYGIDLVDEFIDQCTASPRKNKNTFYLKVSEMEKLKEAVVNKMYIVWVLTFLTNRSELINTLRGYRERLPHLKKGLVLEQVKRHSQSETRHGIMHYYRTVDEYREIFHAAGFKVSGCSVLGERYNGLAYKVIHVTGNFLPRKLARWSDKLFYLDKYLMGDTAGNTGLINDRRPTDILFQLEIA
jgi:SAM-dependent methyltransferase